ncbi:unnamed protein product [Ilex paraguariensis]|uniref:Uncharacterized protein n=1 Tax=Ilex paraguariensis TaxID=185542 RepID=A0ABC8UD40_9AQUA
MKNKFPRKNIDFGDNSTTVAKFSIAVENSNALINEAIADKLDVNQLISSSSSSTKKSFNIADLGCSVGPNTFIAVHYIIESVKLKCQSYCLDSELEFQVFFNDHASNDFNTLFKFLPYDRQYFATGVPGSFHARLFPEASLHFVHSYSLQWLFKIPKELLDQQSLAWNKGEDILAHELAFGGLMALIIPCYPEGTPPSECPLFAIIDLLGATLMEMASMVVLIKRNGYFDIEKVEALVRRRMKGPAPLNHLRAAWEGLIIEHFGREIIDQLFDLFKNKVAESPIISQPSGKNVEDLFILLKRKLA